MKNKWIYFVGGIVLIAILSYLFNVGIFKKGISSNVDTNKLQISTSFYPLYFLASEIGGDKANVRNITPAGSEPHDYEPTSQDIARIETGDMLILNGGVETWGNKIKDMLKSTNATVITAGEGLFTQYVTEGGRNAQDIHVWLDPILLKKEAEVITQAYKKLDPTNASYYQINEEKLAKKLDILDSEYKQGLATCQQRNIITSHAAFGYLASRYQLKQIPIAGLSPEAEPSSQQLAEVTKFAQANNVKYIFFESLVSPKLSETIANEIGAQTLVLDPVEGIQDEKLKQGKNYLTVMQDNLNNLQIALQCSK